ncbi:MULTISPECIES: cysteine--tRNA ligase [Fervidobacterium]|uniref:Cysteine--tRNA ligase n=1 Tax=Fervidobacterium nodosum (strain ATCC 35602 / DSM 5306 / Rt17-B1) TaxID=381764 RepID=SYC_FERNB|nr:MULTISPECIES: cysteine--tRNA ligase [Fervidobacterium]A7HKV1.1 RecName: Full=Cysteine--tRNA ligase; AltName: Full=Cysteinyl-tRNA synthetase; Short=CysRS [Fervidobacterium nodosum Rt17-B1]ABS60534.1 cysteinyl-tRNA synthetase [Fervidobacterium nodosum Rt17-B1]KAF2962504.1 cysteinyl-tRNA synthetase [Fervidobacterium sp. 2310opik-2]
MTKVYITDTLSKSKVPLETLEPGVVKMYVCGPTVYNYIHIGNARPMVVFDALRRFLEFVGYRVIMVQNFTDIDDKIINEAKEWNVDWKTVADTFIAEYFHDAQLLGVRAANYHPRTTDFVKDIVEAIETMIKKDFAYPAENGDVYFSVRKLRDYGKLSGKNLDDLRAGARVDVNELKKDPLDFVLWKSAKPGEPTWDSPWCNGRPGWHIECSVMSQKLLGDMFDIHGGGEDLIFPHHEDEIAQSEALTGKPPAKYWMHNGMIIVRGDKMSKSLGNTFMVREAVRRYTKDGVKLFLLSKHYRSPMEFSDEILQDNMRAAQRVHNALNRFTEKYPYPLVPKIDEEMENFIDRFVEALSDDFNTPVALSILFDTVKELNKSMDEGNDERALKMYHLVKRIYGPVLGVFDSEIQKQQQVNSEQLDQLIQGIINLRNEYRKNKQFEIADKLRDALLNAKIKLLDTPEGTKYEIND